MKHSSNSQINEPRFPVIAFSPVFSIGIFTTIEEFSNIKLSNWIYQTQNQFVFDSIGNKWEYSYNQNSVKKNFWNEIINPYVKTSVKWKLVGSYSINDLKKELTGLAESGDEVMTEYESGDFMKAVISGCSDFLAVCSVLNKHVLSVNETELWKEQEQRA